MVQRLLAAAGREDLLASAELLVSEVVTNALVHSGTQIDLRMAVADDGVLVEVGDGSQHLPVPRNYAPTASTGRGLALLEQTATSWGVVPGIHGKTVWFQLAAGGANGGPARETAALQAVSPTGNGAAATVRVQLLNVPLLLHAAWQQHVEAVLREYLLASIDEAGPEFGDDADVPAAEARRANPLGVHASAVDALSVLEQHIPQPALHGDPDEVMSTAVDPHVSRPRVEVPVPASSVPHFTALDETLEAAVAMSREGLLLTPPVQPELITLRRWLCTEVTGQAEGATPVRWPPTDILPAPERRELNWDASGVTGSAEAAIAADDTDLIVAVSEPCVTLLGYDSADDLVGRRLVSIIPRRYRQAHLAGFTLHQLTGRGPLLDRPVRVPALRHDRSETEVDLSVRVHRVEHGRSVFVATLHEPDAPA
jgi:PAS domain S-box-containing protein